MRVYIFVYYSFARRSRAEMIQKTSSPSGPHPGPLPEGEGEEPSSFRWDLIAISYSLSQGEREKNPFIFVASIPHPGPLPGKEGEEPSSHRDKAAFRDSKASRM